MWAAGGDDMTKYIELTQGKQAIIDDRDYESLRRFKWYAHRDHNTWYAVRCGPKKIKPRLFIGMHHAILGKPLPGFEIDHKNRNGLDNRRANLRVVTRTVNMQNKGRQRNNASGITGVAWFKPTQKWHAKIDAHGKRISLGYFDNIEAAKCARLEGEKKYWGKA